MFPQPEVVGEEFYSTARINVEGENFFEIALKLHNHSSWPARSGKDLAVRYYFSLEEMHSHQECSNKIKVSTNYNQGVAISDVKPTHPSTSTYFIEADFSKANLAPTGEGDSQKEIQFRVSIPNECGKNNLSNDWSNDQLVSFEFRKTPRIPVLERGQLIWGSHP